MVSQCPDIDTSRKRKNQSSPDRHRRRRHRRPGAGPGAQARRGFAPVVFEEDSAEQIRDRGRVPDAGAQWHQCAARPRPRRRGRSPAGSITTRPRDVQRARQALGADGLRHARRRASARPRSPSGAARSAACCSMPRSSRRHRSRASAPASTDSARPRRRRRRSSADRARSTRSSPATACARRCGALAFPELPQPRYSGLIGTGGVVDVAGVAPTNGLMNMTFGKRGLLRLSRRARPAGDVVQHLSRARERDRRRSPIPRAYARFIASLHRDDPLDNAQIMAAVASDRAATIRSTTCPSSTHWSTGPACC